MSATVICRSPPRWLRRKSSDRPVRTQNIISSMESSIAPAEETGRRSEGVLILLVPCAESKEY